MEEIKFAHQYDESLYEKAKVKFDKMLTTDNGKKFFIHLVKSFVLSGTNKVVESTEDPSGLVICDLTKVRLVTQKSFDEFKTNYRIKVEGFLRYENESDESFERRRDSYILAYQTSNPYACDAAMAITADKTDKVLCIEAIQALTDKYNEIHNDPQYESVVKALNFIPKRKNDKFNKNNKKGKKFEKKDKSDAPRVYKTRDSQKTTLGDLKELKELKGKFKS